MSYARYDFMIVGLGVLVPLFILAAALATISNAVYRSVVLQREIATRRVLGARRSHITAMFLAEGISGIWIGILLGGAVVSFVGLFVGERLPAAIVLLSAALLLCAGAGGSWLAARHASRTPFRKSGLFCAESDRRGE